MLLLSRLAGVAVLVWFYLSAKKIGEPPIKWAIIGFIGYWLTWFLVNLTVVKSMAAIIKGSMAMAFVVNLAPAVAGLVACYFIKKKLNADAGSSNP